MNVNRVFFFCLILLATQSLFATEPLHDELTYKDHTGNIFPAKCCWLKKPQSQKLREIQKDIIENRSCSAIGGPVSKLKLENNKLFLTSLYQCGGDIELSEVYPEFTKPALAVWLSGTYYANLNYLCRNKKGKFVYEFEHTFIVNKGIVTSITTVNKDKSTCVE